MLDLFAEIERDVQVYESLREELERDHWGEWVIIVEGKLVAIAPTLDEADRLTRERVPDAAGRLVRKVGEELPQVLEKLWARTRSRFSRESLSSR